MAWPSMSRRVAASCAFALGVGVGAAPAHAGPYAAKAQVLLAVEFTRLLDANTIYVSGEAPLLSCRIQLNHMFGADYDEGPHDLYMGVWRPDGRWQTFVGQPMANLELSEGFTPLARAILPTSTPISTLNHLYYRAGNPFSATDANGMYYVFCMALRAGEKVDDIRNVRNITMVPFFLNRQYRPAEPAVP